MLQIKRFEKVQSSFCGGSNDAVKDLFDPEITFGLPNR